MRSARHIPLVVTLLRLLLGPAFVIARKGEIGAWSLFLIVVLAILTDWLDGFLARRWHVVSSWGKLLDPFADALFCMVVFYDCRQWTGEPGYNILPAWLFFCLVAREVVVTFIVRPVALLRGTVMGASMLGKVKTSFQFGAIVTFAVLQMHLVKGTAFGTFCLWLISLGFYAILGLSWSSAGIYIYKVFGASPQEDDAPSEDGPPGADS